MSLFYSARREQQHFYCKYGRISTFPQPTPSQSSDPLMGLQHWGWKITIVEIDELATWIEAPACENSKNVIGSVLDPVGHMPEAIDCDFGTSSHLKGLCHKPEPIIGIQSPWKAAYQLSWTRAFFWYYPHPHPCRVPQPTANLRCLVPIQGRDFEHFSIFIHVRSHQIPGTNTCMDAPWQEDHNNVSFEAVGAIAQMSQRIEHHLGTPGTLPWS